MLYFKRKYIVKFVNKFLLNKESTVKKIIDKILKNIKLILKKYKKNIDFLLLFNKIREYQRRLAGYPLISNPGSKSLIHLFGLFCVRTRKTFLLYINVLRSLL